MQPTTCNFRQRQHTKTDKKEETKSYEPGQQTRPQTCQQEDEKLRQFWGEWRRKKPDNFFLFCWLSLPDIHACDNNDIPTKLVIKRRRWTILINLLITWTSNWMKSRGNLEAELKERIAFSLMDFVLRSQDCNMFIPLPLCPITTNFPNLNPRFVSSLPSIFTPDHQSNKEKKLMLFLKKEKNIDQEFKGIIAINIVKLQIIIKKFTNIYH